MQKQWEEESKKEIWKTKEENWRKEKERREKGRETNREICLAITKIHF